MIYFFVVICCLLTIAIIILAYLFYKTVLDLTAKLAAKNLYELKNYQKAEDKDPDILSHIPKSDEVLALEEDIANKKRIEILLKEAKKTDLEIDKKAFGVK